MWWILLLGCPWVSKADLDAQLDEVDDDGDGTPNVHDCLPTDPAAHPGAPEVWYDGVDQDCVGGDDYDQDGDGHPSDAWGGDDCLDTSGLVHPGASDPWYDGVDQDCGGDDDFDQDGDGWVPESGAGRETEGVPGSGALPSGDCDDTVATVNPGADDAWYDGVDVDCAGDDDFDQDGDGWVPEGMTYLPTTYAEGTGLLPVGDCDDTRPDVNPDAVETWYDGLDQDCAGDDDDDQDADGYPLAEDCDDEDAGVSPGAVERLGDSTDQDCDGGGDSFVLVALAGTWEGVVDPVFVSDGARLWLSVGVDHVDWDGVEGWDGGFALGWDLATLDLGPVAVEGWGTAPSDAGYALSGVHAARVSSTGELWGLLGVTDGSTRSLRVVRWGDGVTAEGVTAQSVTGTSPFIDGDLQLDDDGVAYAVGCESGEGLLAYVRVDDVSGGYAAVNQETADLGTGACALALGTEPAIYGAVDGAWVAAGFDSADLAPALVPTTLRDGLTFSDLDWVMADAGERVMGVDDGGLDLWTWSPVSAEVASHSPLGGTQVDLYVDSTGSLWAVSTATAGELRLGYGSDLDGLRRATLTLPFTAGDVAIWSEDGELMVAASGSGGLAVGRARTP